ncbi:MAG: hypothetical protein QW688_07275 [Thermoprotei archaeon]
MLEYLPPEAQIYKPMIRPLIIGYIETMDTARASQLVALIRGALDAS